MLCLGEIERKKGPFWYFIYGAEHLGIFHSDTFKSTSLDKFWNFENQTLE